MEIRRPSPEMICLFYFATSVTANINVHAFTAQLVWPLCTDILVTSKSLPHSDWFCKHHRNMVNVVVISQKCFSFAPLLLSFFFFCTLRSSISLVPGSSWTVPALHNCALQTEARIKGVQIIRKSEQWKVRDLSIFSQLGRWLLKNHKCTLKMRGSEVQLSKHSLAFTSVSELFTGMAKRY